MNSGKITFWNDDKGFGFISPDNGGQNVFVHIKAFKRRSQRPEIGQIVSYNISTDDKGRLRALDAKLKEDKRPSSVGFNRNTLSVIGATAFLIGISITAYTGQIPKFAFSLYYAASFVTFIAYALDKSAAKQGGWRTQESTLHLFAIIGGWPGAIIAQQKFRHKTKKKSFRSVFWMTVILNCGGLAWFVTPNSLEKTRAFLEVFLRR